MDQADSKNFYELLGITRDATTDEIKEAYKSIALVYHPDSNFFSEIIDEKPKTGEDELFRRLTEAYNTLVKPNARKEYDAMLPPELPTWGAERPDFISNKITSYDPSKGRNCGATSASYGIFGSVDGSEENDIEDPYITESLSNIIRRENSSFLKRLTRTIKNLLRG